MIAIAPATAHVVYIEALREALPAAERLAALPQLPTRLMALNASFYLSDYLPKPLYRAMLETSIAAAAEERRAWQQAPVGDAPAAVELERLAQAGVARPALYRWLFEQAVASGQPQRLVLAQHACEMAEVLDDRDAARALRVGLLALPDVVAPVGAPLSEPPSAPMLIEAVSRALLCRRISPAQFVAHLLALHAATRARELIDRAFSAPLTLAAGAIQPLLQSDAMQHTPKRLRVASSCELALRAVQPAAQPSTDVAVLAVEAGLVEAETLSSAQQLLLLAALDRLLSS
jgi:hypothetical protein